MKNIRELLKEGKSVYFAFSDSAVCYRFLSDAQLEGLMLGKEKPCTASATDMIALMPEGYLCRVGLAGRMLWKQGGDRIIRIDYEKYLKNDTGYVILAV